LKDSLNPLTQSTLDAAAQSKIFSSLFVIGSNKIPSRLSQKMPLGITPGILAEGIEEPLSDQREPRAIQPLAALSFDLVTMDISSNDNVAEVPVSPRPIKPNMKREKKKTKVHTEEGSNIRSVRFSTTFCFKSFTFIHTKSAN